MARSLRILEWCVAILWVVVAFDVTATYAKEYVDRFGEREVIWTGVMLAIPMVFPWCVGLLFRSIDASDNLSGDKRFAITSLLVASVGLSLAFRPVDGLSEPNLLGVFVPAGLQMVAIYLWLRWAQGSGETPIRLMFRSSEKAK